MEIDEDKLMQAKRELVNIQYFHECTNKHRAWAWESLYALDPFLAELVADDPQAAYNSLHAEEEDD